MQLLTKQNLEIEETIQETTTKYIRMKTQAITQSGGQTRPPSNSGLHSNFPIE